MKKYLHLIWEIKFFILALWLIFFSFTFIGQSPYNIFISFLISGAWALGLTIIGIIATKLKII